MITSSDAISSPATSRMIRKLRRAAVIGWSGSARSQDEQQAAVVVVGREDVRLCRLRAVALGVDGDLLVEDADAPLQRGADVVVAVLELQPQDLLDRTADDVLIAQAGEHAGAPAGADQAALLVRDEERGVRRGVVVVEQLEEEPEAAVLAAAGALGEAGAALGG